MHTGPLRPDVMLLRSSSVVGEQSLDQGLLLLCRPATSRAWPAVQGAHNRAIQVWAQPQEARPGQGAQGIPAGRARSAAERRSPPGDCRHCCPQHERCPTFPLFCLWVLNLPWAS